MSHKRFALVSSTGGSVLQRTYQHDSDFRASLSLIVTDRVCGASHFAQAVGIPHYLVQQRGALAFSDALLDILKENRIDFALLFFTRMIRGRILTAFQEQFINFHPSLLPACSGLHGFEDTIAAGALLAGSTAHFVDAEMDTGPIIQQTFIPVSPYGFDEKNIRHHLFLQQCASLSQICSWLNQDRLSIVQGRRVVIAGGCYDAITGFIPSLESDISMQLLLNNT